MLPVGLSIYISKELEIIMIPGVFVDGLLRDSDKYFKITEFKKKSEIGEILKKSIEISKAREPNVSGKKAFLESTNLKSWNAVYKKYECVSISLINNTELCVTKYRKKRNASYGLDSDDDLNYYKTTVKLDISDEELGSLVLEMYNR